MASPDIRNTKFEIQNRSETTKFKISNSLGFRYCLVRLRRIRISILGFFLLCCAFAFAAFEDFSFSSKSNGMADAYTSLANDLSSIRFNPAGLARLERLEGGVDYRRFWSGIEGLHNITAGIVLPISAGRFGTGLSLQEIGFELQREHSLVLAFGRVLSQELAFGINLIGYHIFNSRFGNGYTYGIDCGFQARVYRKWTMGVYGHNLNQPKISNEPEGDLGSFLRAGIGYQPFPGINSALDLSLAHNAEMSAFDEVRVALGSEFEILPPILLRVGVQNEPARLCGGLGVKFKFLRFDYSFVFQPELPLHHNFGLTAGI